MKNMSKKCNERYASLNDCFAVIYFNLNYKQSLLYIQSKLVIAKFKHSDTPSMFQISDTSSA